MDKILILSFFLGLVLASALGVLFSKRIIYSAFSLFSCLISMAAVFACLGLHTATFAQIILYVGGVMVLVIFALFLNPDDENIIPKWSTVKQNSGLALVLGTLVFWLMAYFPFLKFNSFFSPIDSESKIVSHPSLTGKGLATFYGAEFEVLGLLLLAAIVLAGWYLKSQDESKKI